VQRDKVAFGQKLIERYQFDGQFSRCRFADEWIKRNNAHIEGFRPGCHFAADAAETDETSVLPRTSAPTTIFPSGPRAYPHQILEAAGQAPATAQRYVRQH